MRTTVDVEPQLLERLRLEAARRKVSFKDLSNTTLRCGLAAKPKANIKPYVLPTFRLGAVPEGADLDKAGALADLLTDAKVSVERQRRK